MTNSLSQKTLEAHYLPCQVVFCLFFCATVPFTEVDNLDIEHNIDCEQEPPTDRKFNSATDFEASGSDYDRRLHIPDTFPSLLDTQSMTEEEQATDKVHVI